jgi:hypothetical protein
VSADKPDPRAAFRDALLGQEKSVSEAQFAEYRRRLERRLRRAARRERVMRVAALLTGLAAVLYIPALLALDRLALTQPVKDALFVALATLAGCAVPFLLLYFLRYRRDLADARQEARDVLLLDLHRQSSEAEKRPPAP